MVLASSDLSYDSFGHIGRWISKTSLEDRWQVEIKSRTFAIGVLHFDPAAMSLDDGAHDHEAHAQTLFLCGEELLEKPLASFVRNAAAVIAYAPTDHFGGMRFGADFHLAPGLQRFARGIEGVAHEIDQDLLHLVRVAFDGREIPASTVCTSRE